MGIMPIAQIKRLFKTVFVKSFSSKSYSYIFFVTSKCNAMCEHCFNWRNLNKNEDLKIEEIERLSLSLGKIYTLNISGGEPFLRDDFSRICEIFYKNNHVEVIAIPTNGLCPERIYKQTEEICKIAKNIQIYLNLSLDGTERVHDGIRGVPGCFKKVVETYERLALLTKENPNLKIQITSTVMNKNYDSLFELVDFIKVNMPSIFSYNVAFLRDEPKDKNLSLPSEAQLYWLFEYIDKNFSFKSRINKFIDYFLRGLKIKTLKEKRQLVPCEAGRAIGVIMENGDIKPCELLPSVGNIRQQRINDIWNSEKAKIARKNIVNGKCFCTHECFLFPSLMRHPFKGVGQYFKITFKSFKNRN